jgi:ATP-binding cassette subfamily B protein
VTNINQRHEESRGRRRSRYPDRDTPAGLARTGYREASVIIVDESTSALGPAAEIACFEKIRAPAGPGRAVVLVTHRMAAVQHADLIYVLHHGQLEEQGDHHELLERGGRYASMYRLQADQYSPTSAGPDPAIPRPAHPDETTDARAAPH